VRFIKTLGNAIPRQIKQCPFCLMYRKSGSFTDEVQCGDCPYGQVYGICTLSSVDGGFKKYAHAAQKFEDVIEEYYDDDKMGGKC